MEEYRIMEHVSAGSKEIQTLDGKQKIYSTRYTVIRVKGVYAGLGLSCDVFSCKLVHILWGVAEVFLLDYYYS